MLHSMSLYKRCYCIILFLIVNLLIITLRFSWSFTSSKEVNQIPFFQSRSSLSSIQRAIVVFYPSNQEEYYLPEVRWLYRSWLEMNKYESNQWRTDFLIFTEQYSSPLIELGCIANQRRTSNDEPPKCRVFIYLPMSMRHMNPSTKEQTILSDDGEKDLFHIDVRRSSQLYEYMRTYQFVDSVNIIAEGYPIYAYYDFILKTDLDVFITKEFASYIPNSSKTLFVGEGGYSTIFNTRRLGRIAKDMGWEYRSLMNIGSTWYGSPFVAQRIANFTLDAMLHLSTHEFTPVEREQKLAALLWPDWHFGVLSMYGTHLAVNHLISSEKLDIRNGDQLLDQSTTSSDPDDLEKNHRLHLHCWHTLEPFSKFQFKANKYNPAHLPGLMDGTAPRSYAMRMAIESRLLTLDQLREQMNYLWVNKTNAI